MKRFLVAAILGLSTTAASAGTTSFYFDTYAAHGGLLRILDYQRVLVADGTTFANITWQYGTATGDAGLAYPTTSFPGYGPGWISGPTIQIGPDYISFTPITFTIWAWQGATYASSTARGTYSWVEPGVDLQYQDYHLSGIEMKEDVVPPFHCMGVYLVLSPEPSTLALAGLGAAAALAFRKRSGDGAFIDCRKRRGASLPAALHMDCAGRA
jgi:hypothetical protein